MRLRRLFFIVLLAIISNNIFSQACTTLGQTPSTAFPVCGTTVFSQKDVPTCSTKDLLVPGCTGDGALYADKNPFWYKFTCYASGTLGFTITPKDLGDDYDWQLYDITGHDPEDVFQNSALVVAGNWSGSYGTTGSSATGFAGIQCASDPTANKPRFAKMPNLIVGHQYLLLVSHFTDSQSGYDLSFDGGTASITDPTEPELESATAACGGAIMRIKLNKKVKCKTLAKDGSDFFITPAIGNIISATGVNCDIGFDLDSIILTLNGPITPGNYTITITNGSDSNTLRDNCDRSIPEGDKLPVTVYPIQPTPMDSIKPVGCAPDMLELVFNNNIRCSSIADNGSDFIVTGPNAIPVKIASASGVCTGGYSSTIQIKLSSPITQAGLYKVELQRGSDGNTIIDECGLETPAGSFLNFTGWDTVNAGFDYRIFYGCKTDTIVFAHNGDNGVNSWEWTFDDGVKKSSQSTIMYYSVFGDKNVSLVVSNGVCADTVNTVITLDNTLKASFDAPVDLCPEDVAVFVNNSVAKDPVYTWDFGNSLTSTLKNPAPLHYDPPLTRQKFYTVKLTVQDAYGCVATDSRVIRALNTCLIAVPSAFTPNNDGKNDFLYPLNAYKAINLEFRVYNRLGQLIFYTTDWTKKWDGTFKGNPQPSGAYAWMLSYIHRDTGEKFFYKGTSVLIR